MPEGKRNQPPEYIYLQWGNPEADEGVTWCTDQIHDEDVRYVRQRVRTVREEALEKEFINRRQAAEGLRVALLTLLDAIDYTNGACSPVEPVGGVLPQVLINQARQALVAESAPSLD